MRSWRSNLGHQVCKQVFLPTEGSHWLTTSFLLFFPLFLLFKTEIHCVVQSSLAPNCLWLQRDETVCVGQHACGQRECSIFTMTLDLPKVPGFLPTHLLHLCSSASLLISWYCLLWLCPSPWICQTRFCPKAFVLLLPLRKTSPAFSVIPPSPTLMSLS